MNKYPSTRRKLTQAFASLAAASAMLFATPTSAETAQSYPSRPIKIVVALSPGGPTDNLARVVGHHLSKAWGQPVIIENKPGGGQVIGTAAVAKADPDGYTLLMTTNVFPVNTFIFDKLPYDPDKDFKPVSLVATSSLMLVVNPELNVRTLKELIDYAKQNPGKLNFGSSGPSSSLRLAVELLMAQTGIEMVHVPFKGTGPLTTALLGNVAQLAIVSVPSTKGHIEAGKLRAIAITNDKRSPNFPAVPTMIESGLEGYVAGSWFGLLAPAGTPDPIVEKISKEVSRIMQLPEVRQSMAAVEEIGVGSTPQEFARFINDEEIKWGAIVKKIDLKAN